MVKGRRQIRPWFAVALSIGLALLLGVGAGALAQAPPCVVQCPTPPPSEPPGEEPTPPPSNEPVPTPDDDPQPSNDPPILPKPSPSGGPDEQPTATPDAPLSEFDKAELPTELDQQTIEVPVLARTRPRNTLRLLELLEPLTDTGLSEQQVLIEGMGRFPVAGLAFYSDDWLNPRFTPTFHLHHGLDIFADFGTPIRAPDQGKISRLSTGGAGGIGIWMRGSGGVDYYFAHLLERAPGLEVGQDVEIGTVIGFVGDTGNAQGGSPHLHFEIHRGGAIPPKPTVDRWLDEAEQLAPQWVAARGGELNGKQRILRTGEASDAKKRNDLDATMLLTLLDPVGGSVGLLPRLELEGPAQKGPVSQHLLNELIRLRLHGYLLVPGAHSSAIND